MSVFKSVLELYCCSPSFLSEHPAIYTDSGVMSYRELEYRANAVRELLFRHGVCQGDIVSVCLPKSADAVAVMLGVMKAGAVYHPLNFDAPSERNHRIMADVQPKIIVHTDSTCCYTRDYPVITLSVDLPNEHSNRDALIHPRDVAYVVSTSGSTGHPNSVLIRHESIENYITWKLAYYQFHAGSMKLQFAPLSFDSAISDIFSMLCCGGALYLVSADKRANCDYIMELIGRYPITSFAIVPSLYKRLLCFSDDVVHSLDTITLAGEEVTAEILAEHQRQFPDVRVVNEYGPCECTIGVAASDVTHHAGSEAPPIGRAIANTEVFIRDAEPDEAERYIGEICIAGISVGNGYLGRESETRLKFLHHPDTDEPYYCTGDLGYVNAAGELVFAGRKERTVKVAGNRVNLIEVETAMNQVQGILQSAVIFHEERLKALCVADRTVASIRLALSEHIPDYMIPSVIQLSDILPISQNGKKDYHQITDIFSQQVKQMDIADLRVENVVMQHWKAVLNIPSCRLTDNFFDIGGNSLLFIDLIMDITKAFDISIDLSQLLEKLTLQEQISYIENLIKDKSKEINE
ncbi:non-ribosomal peptide synthetase [Vibrio spartinae]|uniref:Plipastatin synthase subunit B n=1 Tax=Vibrio spartinae TaxID=1918945 RepID=A0A1N6M314_9VIBR|nr:non-ribosomal peptide synthetase [Vibrio spartinae]SIO93757.1 Plipastatin synthase subunit B [Vibrio spartinae]